MSIVLSGDWTGASATLEARRQVGGSIGSPVWRTWRSCGSTPMATSGITSLIFRQRRDVADYGNEALPSVSRTDANFNGKFATVASQGEQFPPESHGANGGIDGEFRVHLGMPLAVSLGDECLDLDTDDLAWLVAEEVLGVLVCEHDRPVTAHDVQGVRNGLVRGVDLGSHIHCVTPLFLAAGASPPRSTAWCESSHPRVRVRPRSRTPATAGAMHHREKHCQSEG